MEAGVQTTGQPPNALDSAISNIQDSFGVQVSLMMAMHRLMRHQQGTKSFAEFVKEIEELGDHCQLDRNLYTCQRAHKMLLKFGTADDKVHQEALAKDYDLASLIKAGQG